MCQHLYYCFKIYAYVLQQHYIIKNVFHLTSFPLETKGDCNCFHFHNPKNIYIGLLYIYITWYALQKQYKELWNSLKSLL